MRTHIYEFNPDDAMRFAYEQGINAKRKGNELMFNVCPYCHGNFAKDKKTFAINLKTGAFNCMRASCGAKGNMITLARDFNFSLGRDVDEYINPSSRYKNMRKYGRPKSKPAAVAYMESRGISREVTESYALTTQRDRDNILVFPFFDESGNMQFAKYRKTDFNPQTDNSKEWCEANCKPILFGMDKCDPEACDTLVMTEGQIDSLSCAEAGIPNAVSVPTGKNGFTWVPHCWDFLSRFKTLIVFGDYERKEITLLAEMKERFHGIVKHVRPEDYKGCKDANEILRKYGKQAVREAVANAVIVDNSHIKGLETVKRRNLSEMESFSSGIGQLDNYTGGFYFGQLIVLTGERGKGKSTLGSQFIAEAVNQGFPSFCYSGELPDWCFRDWFDRQAAGANHVTARRQPNGFIVYSVDTDAVWPVQQWYTGRCYIYDDSIIEGDDEGESLIQTIRKAIVQYGCRVLLLDNLMTAMQDDTANDFYRQQSVFVRELATMARKYNVCIFLVAHPRKSNLNEFRNDDVSGSGNITNLASMVLQYGDPRDENDPGDRILRVTKDRLTGYTNYKGIPLWFQESSKRISETENEFNWMYSWETDADGFGTDDMEIPFGEDEADG